MKQIKYYIFIIILILFFSPGNFNALNIALPYVQYTLALDLYGKGDYYNSIREFNNLINEHSEEISYLGRAYYWIGLNYFSLRKYETADSYFLKVINNYPDSSFYKNAVYYHGQTQYVRKHYNTAIPIFSRFYKNYPSHELADNSLFWEGVSYYKLKKSKTALNYFYNVIKKYPLGNKADASRYMINLIKGGAKQVIVKTVGADSSQLDAFSELLKTKEEALKEKEQEVFTKEKTLNEKEKIINQAQEKLQVQ